MTKRQLQSTGWFGVITVVLITLSILTSKTISSTDLSNLIKAVDELSNQVSTEPSPILPSTPITATSSGSIALPTASESAKVTRVIDGDTFELESGQKVRLIGIDTPELHHPQKGVQCFGTEAFERTKALLEGKVVNLEKDVSQTDRYGRLLRYVWLDTTLVNESMILEGYAYASSYPPDIKYQNFFEIAEGYARNTTQGLWQKCPVSE